LETLTKYAFTGPILIFFLWLGLKLSASVTSADKLGQIVGSVPNSNGDFKYLFFGLVAKNMTTLFEMFTIIITVWAGILIANRFGIKGAASINGLMKGTGGLIHAIPWYSGRVASWGSLLFGKVASGWSQRRSAQAELARSTGDTAKADDLEKRAKWWTDKEIMVKKQKDRAIKAFSVMNPFIMKKQFAAWWNQNVKEHMEQSEASVDEFGRDLVRTITFGKGKS
jgi:hypothetical protein